MDLWRISKYSSLSGEGGLRYSARWHTAGRRIVYLAESPAGAMIEVLVHMELNEKSWPRYYDLMRVTAPDNLGVEAIRVPGEDWKRSPDVTRKIGDQWLDSQRTVLARVPSAILPNTWNVLLNPAHRAANRVHIAETVRAEYDPRLFAKSV